jgi:hypothetical protein
MRRSHTLLVAGGLFLVLGNLAHHTPPANAAKKWCRVVENEVECFDVVLTPKPKKKAKPKTTAPTVPLVTAPPAATPISQFPFYRGRDGRCFRQDPDGPGMIPAPCPAPTEPDQGAQFDLAWYLNFARDQAKPPAPTINIAPGFAIPGLKAFLETGGDNTYASSANWVDGPVGWNCTIATSAINWGDGEVTKFNRSDTGPYPDGDVHHIYDEPGYVTVTVQEAWLCNVDIPSPTPLTGAPTIIVNGPPAVIADFEIRELQAVITG